MQSKLTDDDSEGLLLSKRVRGRVRLPPLPRTIITGDSGFTESKRRGYDEMEANGIFIGNTYPHGTEKLHIPKVYKHPTSPSNLSIQFNFDEEGTMSEVGKPKQLVSVTTQLAKSRRNSNNGHKRLQNAKARTKENELSNAKVNKGNSKKQNDEKKSRHAEAVKTVEVGRYQALSGTSTVKATCAPRERKTKVKTVKTTTVPNGQLKSGAQLDVNNNEQRNNSIYDLREFLSLPPDINHGTISPVVNKNESHKTLVVKGKQTAKLSKSASNASYCGLNRKQSGEYRYDIFEFLALPEPELSSGGKTKQKLRRLKKENKAEVKCTTVSGKKEIPTVVVADWSLKNDSPVIKRAPRKNCIFPKANNSGNNFLERADVLIAPSGANHRKSLYDLKEFLNLPELSSKSMTKVTTKDLELLSREYKQEIRRESEVQYDLREFLTFLECRTRNDCGGSGSGASVERPQTSPLRDSETYRSRELSVYDIYEFLKVTNTTNSRDDELKSCVCTDDLTSSDSRQGNEGKGKPSIIDLTKFFAKSSSKSSRSLEVMHKTTDEASTAQGFHSESRYDLREFLRLSVAAELTQTESETKARSTFA